MKQSIYLVLSAVLIASIALTACGGIPTAAPVVPSAATVEPPTAPSFDWQMKKGEELRVAMVSQPWTIFLEPHIPEFEELTGIDVTYEILPEDQFRQKTTVEFTAGTSDVDVFLSMVAQEGIKYESAGWYEDIGKLVENTEITDPDFDFADFTSSGIGISTLSNGKLIGLPTYNEFGSLMFNKALFDAAGVAYPPTTLEEVEKAAAAINNPSAGVYGWCARGKGAAATSQFSSIMFNYGSEWAIDGKANLLDQKWLDAMAWYGNMDRTYGPPGTTAMHYQQCQDLMLQGKIGMWMDASVFFANLVDPAQSTIASTAGITMAPEGPAGRTPYVSGWHISIYSQSKHKDAAWLFIQWALSKDMTLKAQLANITTGRVSAWESPEYKAANKFPELSENFLIAMSQGNTGWNPPVLAVGEARDAIGVVIITAIEGGDIKAEATKANAKLQELLDATPKLK